MSNIPTAEEFFRLSEDWGKTGEQVHQKMIEFANLHVEAALKEAVKKVIVNNYIGEGGIKVSKNSILNSYPLENIK